MTRLGQVLVFVNLVFCVFLAAWSVANFATRTQWKDPEQQVGELVELHKQIEVAWKAYPEATPRWARSREEVLAREAGRPEDRRWDEDELRLLRSAATGKNPSREAVPDAKGQTVPDPKDNNRPKMQKAKARDGTDLLSLEEYTRLDAAELTRSTEKLAELLKLIDEDIELTAKMNGPKGLKQRLEDE